MEKETKFRDAEGHRILLEVDSRDGKMLDWKFGLTPTHCHI